MTTFEDRMDPELAPALEVYTLLGFDATDLSGETLATMRTTLDAVMAAAAEEAPPNPDVETSEVSAPLDDGTELGIRVHAPTADGDARPLVYWIHGGGMIIGSASMDDLACQAMVAALDCVVAAPDYRLAPEHPHPTPVEDCHAGLRWAIDNAAELGADPDRVVLAGASAGGGLAAGVALMNRDRGGPDLALQVLVYPMLDDRNATPSAQEFSDILSWSAAHNRSGWAALLGDAVGGDDVPAYAAPARADDLSGLPPTFVQVGELEVFRDEDVEFAVRLLRAGVPTELHVYPGAVHGWDAFAPDSGVGAQAIRDRMEAIARAVAT